MNKELMKGVVMSEVTNKLIGLVEELTTNEFIESVIDKYCDETGEEEVEIEDVKDTVWYEILPLLTKLIIN